MLGNNQVLKNDALYMLKYFPMLVPSYNYKQWNGIVNINGSEVVMCIDVPHYPTLEELNVHCTSGFQSVVDAVVNQVNLKKTTLTDLLKLVQQSNTVIPYYQPFCSTENVNSVIKNCLSLSGKYEKLITELNCIGASHVSNIDQDLTHVHIRSIDNTGHVHTLHLKIPDNYPYNKPVIEYCELPDVALLKFTHCNTISEIFTKLCSVISDLQEFWCVYDSLHNYAWVVDPEHPTKRDTCCRIVVGENIDISVTLNPLDVTAYPDIKFLGSDRATAPLRKRLDDNLKEFGWNTNADLISNLLFMIGLDAFPQPPSTSKQDNIGRKEDCLLVNEQECSICFQLRSDDNLLPAKLCNNEKCNSVFHVACLAAWFQNVPTYEASFNFIAGDCPICEKRILCPLESGNCYM